MVVEPKKVSNGKIVRDKADVLSVSSKLDSKRKILYWCTQSFSL